MAYSLQDSYWIVGGNLNMVEWEGDQGGGVGSIVCGAEKPSWSRHKDIIQNLDPKWGKRGLESRHWFTWPIFQKGKGRVKARLDRVYGPRHNLSFPRRIQPIDVLIEIVSIDHYPIQTSILVGDVIVPNPSSLFNPNVLC